MSLVRFLLEPPVWRYSQVVRQRSAKPLFPGSNPGGASLLTHFLDLLAAVISVTSLLIVTYGALIGIISFLKNEIRRFTGGYSITNIRKLRATFGTYLLLGLEFLIASDILKTVLEPTLNELALLGGIVVLRTILSVFLNKEIKELESEEK